MMCCFPCVELERAWDEGFKFSEKEITHKVKLLFAPEMYSAKREWSVQNHGATSFILVRNSHQEHRTSAV